MEQYTKLVISLESAVALLLSNGAKCRCEGDYKCSLCKIIETLNEGESNIKRGTVEGLRARRRILCETTGREFESIIEGAKYYGIQPSTISKCLKGKLKVGGSFNGVKLVWRYQIEEENNKEVK